jgi:hypothetical protein
MNVAEALSIAERWAAEEIARTPNEVVCALTWGSINWMAAGDPFPPSSDVDVLVVVPEVDPARHRVSKRAYGGVAIEPFYLPRERFVSAEALLVDFALAPNLVHGKVLFDSARLLEGLRSAMAPEIARRCWMRRRCRARRDAALTLLAAFESSDSLPHLNGVTFHAVMALGQMALIADLQNPTVKKALVKARDVLGAYGLGDEHHRLLSLLGVETLDGEAVLVASHHCRSALDLACEWLRTPFPADNQVSRHSRSALDVDVPACVTHGTGREIFLWVAHLYSCAMIAIQNDAPPEAAAPVWREYLQDMARVGAAAPAEAHAKMLACRSALQRMATVCDDIVGRNRVAEGA